MPVQPYYEQDGITIYHGDCREVLPGLPPVDLVLTDPPYGYSHESGWSSLLYGNVATDWDGSRVTGDDSSDARDHVLSWASGLPCLVFGSWKITPPAGTHTVLVWDKGEASGMGDLSVPWKPSWESIYVIGKGFAGHRGGGVLRAYVPPRISMGRLHPTEKPVSLIRELLSKCPPGLILDPFMGSGTTLRAAKDLGRRAIGIEIEERYCEIAAKRLMQSVLPLGDVA
jgi:DNA modification methylase